VIPVVLSAGWDSWLEAEDAKGKGFWGATPGSTAQMLMLSSPLQDVSWRRQPFCPNHKLNLSHQPWWRWPQEWWASPAGDLVLSQLCFEFVWVCFGSRIWSMGLLAWFVTAALSPAGPWEWFWFLGM